MQNLKFNVTAGKTVAANVVSNSDNVVVIRSRVFLSIDPPSMDSGGSNMNSQFTVALVYVPYGATPRIYENPGDQQMYMQPAQWILDIKSLNSQIATSLRCDRILRPGDEIRCMCWNANQAGVVGINAVGRSLLYTM